MVITGTSCGLDGRGSNLGKAGDFFFPLPFRLVVVSTQPSIQWTLGTFPRLKRPGREFHYSLPSIADRQLLFGLTSVKVFCSQSKWTT